MRIAVSGTHFIGKSTFIVDFIRTHPEYRSEIEPYYKLQDEKNIHSSLEPCFESLLEQLDYSVAQLNELSNERNCIFDRCPVDFIAYAMCLLEKEAIDIADTEFSEKFPEIKEALDHLDFILFFPIDRENSIEFTEENPAYRKAVDTCFKTIFRDDRYDIFPRYNHPRIIEITGNRVARIKALDYYLGS